MQASIRFPKFDRENLTLLYKTINFCSGTVLAPNTCCDTQVLMFIIIHLASWPLYFKFLCIILSNNSYSLAIVPVIPDPEAQNLTSTGHPPRTIVRSAQLMFGYQKVSKYLNYTYTVFTPIEAGTGSLL